MITVGYLIITVMCLVALYYSAKLWLERRDAMSLLILAALSLLWLDNFAIAVGAYVGEGLLLTSMSYARYFVHWQVLPVLMIVAGILLRRGGFAFAQNKIVMGLFCVVAVIFMAMDVPYIFQIDFYPACYGDTFRLVTNVPASQICDPANPPPQGISVAPIPAISVNVTLMIVGFALWVRHGFKWLALSCLFMFVAAGLSQMPGFYYGQILGNLGEPIFNAGLIAAAYRFGGKDTGEGRSAEVAAPA